MIGCTRSWNPSSECRLADVARFVLTIGPKEFVLVVGEIVVGRDPTCDLRFEDTLVSRRHARLEVDRARVSIEDLGSRNGVFVDGKPIARRTALVHGATITIGTQALVLVAESSRFQSEPPTCDLPRLRSSRPPAWNGLGTAPADADALTQVASLRGLSKREREVLELLAQGHTQREIGERLGLSAKTVETYRARIAQKLGVTSRSAIVRYALNVGLLRK